MTKNLKDEVRNDLPTLKKNPPKKKPDTDNEEKYQLATKNFWLTYPNCDMDFPAILSCLRTILVAYTIEDFLIRKQYNKIDKNPTVLVYLKLQKKANIISRTFLDVVDTKGERITGDYKAVKVTDKDKTIEALLVNITTKDSPDFYCSPELLVKAHGFIEINRHSESLKLNSQESLDSYQPQLSPKTTETEQEKELELEEEFIKRNIQIKNAYITLNIIMDKDGNISKKI